MKKIFFLFCIFVFIVHAKDEFSYDGSIRFASLHYNFEDGYFPDSEATVLAAKLSLTTPTWNNIYLKTSVVALQGINKDKNKQGFSYVFANTWEEKYNSFALLEELYLAYETPFISLKIGRQEMALPYIDSDDYFVVPNSFEALSVKMMLENITLYGGYVSKMSGTWDASYDGGNFHSMSRQAWIHYSNGVRDTYPVSEVYQIVGNQGISYAGLVYTEDRHTLQVWDFYAHEMFNTFLVQYGYKGDKNTFALQYSSKKDVGKLKEDATYKVDYEIYGAKIAREMSAHWNLEAGYTAISDDDSLHFLGSWGGYPEFASGMILTYFETYLRDSQIFALTSKHNMSKYVKGLSLRLRYAYYDLNENYTVNVAKGSINGESSMDAYGIEAFYSYNEDISLKVQFAGRELESGNSSELVRAVLKYNF
jgi:hypothetical protein